MVFWCGNKITNMASIIKKVLFLSLVLALALPALAQTASSAKELNVACVQAAVEKRENALISAFSAYHTAMGTALSARLAALKSAWAATAVKERRAALKSAWQNYKNALSAARKTFANAKKDAWKQYLTDRKACGKPATSDDTASSGTDNSL
jgi:hypothetical protein